MSGYRFAQLAFLVDATGRPVGFKELDGDETFFPTFNQNFTSLIKPDGSLLALGGSSPTGEGVAGASAYQVAVNNGFQGTEQQWLASLVGPAGRDGTNGTNGKDGTNGTNGSDGAPGGKGDTGSTGPAGPGVPAGGTAGQVLVKNTSADFDTSWQAQASGGATPSQSGNVDNNSAGVNRYLTSAGKTMTSSTLTTVDNRVYFVPFYLRQPTIISALAVNVSSAGAAGASAQAGIYNRNAQGYIGDLLASVTGIDTSTTGMKQISLAGPIPLAEGWYFTALLCSQTAGVTAYSTAVANMVGGSPLGLSGITPIDYRYQSAGAAATLPASASPTTTGVNTGTSAAPPLVYLVPQ